MILSLYPAIHYFLRLPLNFEVSKRLFSSSIVKKWNLIELTANYSTIFYDYNLTTKFLPRPIFALYLMFRHGRQTLMDSYNFVSPTIGIASFFTDLVKFLADERRIKLFTAIDFFFFFWRRKREWRRKGTRKIVRKS